MSDAYTTSTSETTESAAADIPTYRTEVLVLGAGPGGYVAAIRAAQLGFQVTVVEEQYWGGVCLNIGCIPSKALLKNAEVAHTVLHRAKDFGITGTDLGMDYEVAHSRSRRVSESIVKGVHYLMHKNGIQEVNGRGEFLDEHTLQVSEKVGRETVTTARYHFDYCIIATGAQPVALPDTTMGGSVMTFAEHIMSPELPRSIVIVGAGAIGMEFAYVLSQYGVDVTIVEYQSRILPTEDAAISAEMVKLYKKMGVHLLTGTQTTSIRRVRPRPDEQDRVTEMVEVEVRPSPQSDKPDTPPATLRTERCLVATGFRPRVEGYGLERTGVRLTERGAIDVDGVMRTSVPHIFAIGDVTALLQLAHVAEAQGVTAAEALAGKDPQPFDATAYRMMPRAIFTHPQVASFGYTEEQATALAEENGWDVRVSTFPFSANGKAVGLGEGQGFVKIVADAHYGELLGAHLVGPHVSELLPELVLAQKWDLTTEEIGATVHIHPTLSEALKEAVDGVMGQMINL